MPGVSRIAPTLVFLAIVAAGPAMAQGTAADDQRRWRSATHGRGSPSGSPRHRFGSAVQVVNQLIKHNKGFDLLVVPGMDHGSGGAYSDHKRYDFFVRNLPGVPPPDWKTLEDAAKKKTSTN